MKILVTGANGYIGQGVVSKLIDNGHDVVATDFCLNRVDKRAVLQSCNLFEVTNPYLTFEKPDILLHLAWRDGFKHDSDTHLLDLPMHYQFIRRAIESGIRRICVMGSMHEVGYHEGVVNADTPTNPQSLYGISKNALRQSISTLQTATEFEFLWMRGFYIVGNNRYGCSVFSKIQDAAEKGQARFPFTSGENQYDFIDYSDFCDQIATAACKVGETGIIHCCSGKPMKLKQRVEQFLLENHYDMELEYGKFPDRPYDSKAIWGDNTRILQLMGDKSEKFKYDNFNDGI